ncbi:MAG: ion transporter [Gammaproteobacteria bacterium]|nr:ion transporter [Gammaproteobacteria bacterium]
MTLRRKIYQVLEPTPGSPRIARVVTLFIVVLVLLNVAANILASVQDLYIEYHHWLFIFEAVSTLIFSVEYLSRLWSCVDSDDSRFHLPFRGRVRFAMTPMMVIDLLAILPFYLLLWTSMDLLFLRVFRLFRIFKLTRYSPAMGMLLTVLRKEARAFGAAMFILVVIMVFAASGIYLVEHESQPEAFGSIPAAMWWSVATLTTVGYGDVVPVTLLGKLFGASITIVGVGMVALPAGILASAFSDEMRKRREQFMLHVDEALEDGYVSNQEQLSLETQRRNLGLEKGEVEHMLRTAEVTVTTQRTCPHCRRTYPD